MKLLKVAESIFLHAVKSVQSRTLIRNVLKREGDSLLIKDQKYLLNKNVVVIGFGKAVLGMAYEVSHILQEHIKQGVLSIPVQSPNVRNKEELQRKSFEIYEGAENNLPDHQSEIAATEIKNTVEGLGKDSLLLVLISGGGSALLCLPNAGISLQEKRSVIEKLSHCGATIQEINTVRKRLSQLKGGKLARLASPAKIVALILSDVIGDPLDIIASGPTVENSDSLKSAFDVLMKYKMIETLSSEVRYMLEVPDDENVEFPFVQNVIIGSNSMALKAAADHATTLDFFPVVLTDSICGDVQRVSKFYSVLAKTFLACSEDEISPLECMKLITTEGSDVCSKLNFPLHSIESSIKVLREGKSVCFIAGGETTVVVRGTGKGGRNQELALRMSIEIATWYKGERIMFLSAGTDGIDGYSNAAGAFMLTALDQTLVQQIQDTLDRNDSNGFYMKFDQGSHLILTDHTDTNVMDIHIMIIMPHE